MSETIDILNKFLETLDQKLAKMMQASLKDLDELIEAISEELSNISETIDKNTDKIEQLDEFARKILEENQQRLWKKMLELEGESEE